MTQKYYSILQMLTWEIILGLRCSFGKHKFQNQMKYPKGNFFHQPNSLLLTLKKPYDCTEITHFKKWLLTHKSAQILYVLLASQSEFVKPTSLRLGFSGVFSLPFSPGRFSRRGTGPRCRGKPVGTGLGPDPGRGGNPAGRTHASRKPRAQAPLLEGTTGHCPGPAPP